MKDDNVLINIDDRAKKKIKRITQMNDELDFAHFQTNKK